MLAYNTRFGRAQKKIVDSIIKGLDLLLVTGDDITKITDDVISPTKNESTLPGWKLPLIFQHGSKLLCAVDLRRWVNDKGNIRNSEEYNLAINMAKLEHIWATDRHYFKPVILPISILYGIWISNIVTHRYKLDLHDSVYLKAALALYYSSLIHVDQELYKASISNPRQVGVLKNHLNALGGVPGEVVDNLLGTGIEDRLSVTDEFFLPEESRLDGILDGLKNSVFHTPVDWLGSTSLSNMLSNSGSWFGDNASIYSVVAAEHPPVFIAMLMRSTEVSFLSKTGIGRAAGDGRKIIRKADLAGWYKKMVG